MPVGGRGGGVGQSDWPDRAHGGMNVVDFEICQSKKGRQATTNSPLILAVERATEHDRITLSTDAMIKLQSQWAGLFLPSAKKQMLNHKRSGLKSWTPAFSHVRKPVGIVRPTAESHCV